MAWCALIALELTRQEGKIQTVAQENLFLTRWLSAALKQRRFTREISVDIEWLLDHGRRFGVRAQLASKLRQLWTACNSDLSDQSDLFRLTFALETAREKHFHYQLLSDREWAGRHALVLSGDKNGIYLCRTNLEAAFDDGGKQVLPLYAKLTGSTDEAIALLTACGWHAEHVVNTGNDFSYVLAKYSAPRDK